MSVTIATSEIRWHSFVSDTLPEWQQEYLAEFQNFSVGVIRPSTPTVDEQMGEEELERRAVNALTALVQQNPLSLPLLITAIEGGCIDGSTYYGDYTGGRTAPRCIVGWTMVATEAISHFSSHLRVADRRLLEEYVQDIRVGETHLTNKRLAILYAALTDMYVDKVIEKDVVGTTVEDSIPTKSTQASEQLPQSVAVFLNSMEERIEHTADRQLVPDLIYA